MDEIEYPTGPRQAAWFRHGYRAGMADLQAVIDNGGDLEAVQTWIKDNA